jgi:hypothetical protein
VLSHRSAPSGESPVAVRWQDRLIAGSPGGGGRRNCSWTRLRFASCPRVFFALLQDHVVILSLLWVSLYCAIRRLMKAEICGCVAPVTVKKKDEQTPGVLSVFRHYFPLC